MSIVEKTIQGIAEEVKFHDVELMFNPSTVIKNMDKLIDCIQSNSSNAKEFINNFEENGCTSCKFCGECMMIIYSWFIGLLFLYKLGFFDDYMEIHQN